ncbi:MAG: hypothetical protein J6K62_02145 [Clostridia bacterium]|nr:hypothetical protein [Clostridia bacterium]
MNCVEREEYPCGTTAERRRQRLKASSVGAAAKCTREQAGGTVSQYPCPVAAVIGM